MTRILRDCVDEVGPLPGVSSKTPEVGISCSGIYEISKLLTAAAPLEITLVKVANILPTFLRMRHGAIVIWASEGEPEITASAGVADSRQSGARHTIPPAAMDQIVTTGQPLVIRETSKSELFRADPQPSLSSDTIPITFIGVPLRAAHKLVGTLWIDRFRDSATELRHNEDIRFLTMVADLIGQTIAFHRALSTSGPQIIQLHRKSAEGGRNDPSQNSRAKVDWIVGESPAVRRVLEIVSAVAMTNTTVLLRGESGTGKEFFAQAIHELSPRRKKSFVKLNCAALPEGVLESELFGHEKGAFTGAVSQRAGRFELANGGTLLLDEIGEISPAFQAKLLRVLQEGELERVGGTKTLKVDIRLVCATNKDLEAAVANGEFRADLYYRINVVPIVLPPLRERPGDISRLSKVFLDRFNRENNREHAFTAQALDLISQCYFPGNVRELENCVRRTATLARSKTIVPSDFACQNNQCLSARLWKGDGGGREGKPIDELTRGGTTPAVSPLSTQPGSVSHPEVAPFKACDPNGPACPALSPRLTERDRLIEAMEKVGWVQAKAARMLGLTPRQVGYALRRHNIEMKKF
ncbi:MULTISPECIES: nif-specific transcriptional activator NifA [Rhizobium]|uniref:Nif-specific regulatory protein n=3 Tax=Rhizobium TaxID=379 RepID=A0A6P1CI42_RHITR|nr:MULTISPECIES: nif-specific transcriptional activator NifA [Rhizobium]AGB73555.1 transcriptional regulator NifA [Rhizobium tropici CIAT 899]AYG70469.1 nif-specific transcriptional activator NifA [Rhizobium sp. CCGE531]AYG76903.1 nif-specific transcriptional activator NifA [Rhizobium sp. CCGE532]ENN84808.1 transcriptional regulator NifA [Rhizobium freirei PRF 81]MBB4245011.1 Nif-specific regulatory protein [Rhizobium tropici]